MNTKAIYYKRDFKSAISLAANAILKPFCFTYTSGKLGLKKYVASYDGEKFVNCRISGDGTRIIVMFDNHNLSPGPLRVIRNWMWDDPDMPTGVFNDIRAVDTGIYLSTCPNDVPSDEETESVVVEDEVLLNMLRGKAMTYDDLTPEQIAELQKPARDAVVDLNEVTESIRKMKEDAEETKTAAAAALDRVNSMELSVDVETGCLILQTN